MVRKFLTVFVLPNFEKRERAALAKEIKLQMERVSGGDMQLAFVSDFVFGFLFTSASPASEIDFKTPTAVKILTTEVGESFAHQGLPNPGHWLWERRQRR